MANKKIGIGIRHEVSKFVHINTDNASYLRKCDLSLAAMGLLTKMLTESETWNFTEEGYAAQLVNCSLYSIKKAFDELVDKNYLIRRQLRENGNFSNKTEYHFREIAFTEEEKNEIMETFSLLNNKKDEEIIVAENPKTEIEISGENSVVEDVSPIVEIPISVFRPTKEITNISINNNIYNNIDSSNTNTVLSNKNIIINNIEDKTDIIKSNIPTYEDVRKYMVNNNLNFSVQDFIDYYSERDWLLNGEPIHSWKSLAKIWSDKQFVKDTRFIGENSFNLYKSLPKELQVMIDNDQQSNTKGWIRKETKDLVDEFFTKHSSAAGKIKEKINSTISEITDICKNSNPGDNKGIGI